MNNSKLSPRQKDILLLLYSYRFLHTNQIQQLLHHKEPTRIQSWLKQLTAANYIGRIYTRSTYDQSSKPAIYYLRPLSRTVLLKESSCDRKILERVYKEGKQTPGFITHSLDIADLHLFFLSQKGKLEALEFFTKTELAGYLYFPSPLPDAYISITEHKETRRFFLDLFDPLVPLFVLKKRIRKYHEYAESGAWEENTNGSPFPSILLVCSNKRMQARIYTELQKKHKDTIETISLFLTSLDQIRKKETESPVWQSLAIPGE